VPGDRKESGGDEENCRRDCCIEYGWEGPLPDESLKFLKAWDCLFWFQDRRTGPNFLLTMIVKLHVLWLDCNARCGLGGGDFQAIHVFR